MKSKWIDHKGTRILFADYSNFEDDKESLFAEVEAVDAIVQFSGLNAVIFESLEEGKDWLAE